MRTSVLWTMAALQTEGCQVSEKKDESSGKPHSRNGSIEKYFFKKRTSDAGESVVTENGTADQMGNTSGGTTDKNSSLKDDEIKGSTQSLESEQNCDKENQANTEGKNSNVHADKSSNVSENGDKVEEDSTDINTEDTVSADVQDNKLANSEEGNTPSDVAGVDKGVCDTISSGANVESIDDISETLERPECSEENKSAIDKEKECDLDDSKMAENSKEDKPSSIEAPSEIENSKVSDLSDSKSTSIDSSSVNNGHTKEESMSESLKSVPKVPISEPMTISENTCTLQTFRPKLKQKARKSSKPFRQLLTSSSIKTVNLAPIANVKVKLPDIENALNLAPAGKADNAKPVLVKKSISGIEPGKSDTENALNVTQASKPESAKPGLVEKSASGIESAKSEAQLTTIFKPPSQESCSESKSKDNCSLPPSQENTDTKVIQCVKMNSRVRHHRKRSRRWGRGDLPIKKPKKKPLIRLAPETLLETLASENTVIAKSDNKFGEKSSLENGSLASLTVRPKPSPTILQLLTKNRPKLACKNLSMLRAKKLRMGERTGKTVAELVTETQGRRIQVQPNEKARIGKVSDIRTDVTSLLSSPGVGCGRRVSLRKRKPTGEDNDEESPEKTGNHGNSTIMATPGSGSKKRKMCTPERVVSGGEHWQKGNDFELPEADQGSRESPDLPPLTESSITTVTKSEGMGAEPSVNVEISLDPPIITMSDMQQQNNANSNTVSENAVMNNDNKPAPVAKNECKVNSTAAMKNSTLRSVLLDQSTYTHPLLGRKSAISLLSGKSSNNTLNGAICPVTPAKPERADGPNQPRPASAPGVGSSSPPQREIIPLCCCKLNGACVTKQQKPVVYCQALDSVDGKVMGCCNKVSSPQLVRPGVKIPFMAVCEVHRKRLKLHQCCPGCGHFCTQGQFFQCRKEGSSSIHHFHKTCHVFRGGKFYCPHCGEESAQFEVNLRLNEPRHMTKFGKSEQDLKLTLSRAKMAITSNTYKPKEGELSESVATATYTVEGTNKVFSTAGLPFGPDRYSLERILYLLPQERPKKYRVLPKCMYGPAKEGDLDKVVYMLVDGYDPNEKFPDFDGQSSVHAAAICGNLPITHVLVQASVDVNCIDNVLKTPLMYAAENNHITILKYLMKSGANVHTRGEDGMTCLHLAAMQGHNDIIQYLLHNSDLDINVQDDGGWTPIIWAAEHRHVSTVKFLLAQGANPNLKDREENTGLHWAAFSGSVDIAEIFLNAGCDIEAPNEHGDRPLHIAARQDHYECVVLILARGADVEAKNNESVPPIGCCLDQNSQVWMALRVNKQLKGFASKRLGKTERLIHRDITLGKENNPIPGVNAVDDEVNPTDYLYIIENCETTPLNINRTITSLQSCSCTDNCSSMNCNCSRNSVKCWFDKNGRLLPEFNTLEPPLIFECNRACRCWTTCNNRVVQNGITARLQLFRTSGRGWGIKTLLDIPQGSFICEYIGELISDSEADRREDDSYLFDLDNKDGETYCIDARKYGNVARFINHLCEPNIIPVKVFVEHQDLRFPRICFYSSRLIKAQEELGFDYGEKFWMIKWKQFTCECGSEKCKYSSENIQKTLEEYRLRHEDDETVRD